jgi:hypothetical protein
MVTSGNASEAMTGASIFVTALQSFEPRLDCDGARALSRGGGMG